MDAMEFLSESKRMCDQHTGPCNTCAANEFCGFTPEYGGAEYGGAVGECGPSPRRHRPSPDRCPAVFSHGGRCRTGGSAPI
jgi:hypothetical protein